MKYVFLVSTLIICLASCVSKKKLQQSEMKYAQLDSFYVKVQQDLKACRDEEEASARKRAQMESEAQALYKEIDFLKKNNNQMIGQLKDLSVISSSQAESIKKSLENIGSKDIYIQDLQKAILSERLFEYGVGNEFKKLAS
jgi:chemotaxis protein MotB